MAMRVWLRGKIWEHWRQSRSSRLGQLGDASTGGAGGWWWALGAMDGSGGAGWAWEQRWGGPSPVRDQGAEPADTGGNGDCGRSGGCQGRAGDGACGRAGLGAVVQGADVASGVGLGLGPSALPPHSEQQTSPAARSRPRPAPHPLTLGLHPPAADHAQVFPEVPGEKSTRGCWGLERGWAVAPGLTPARQPAALPSLLQREMLSRRP